MAAKQFQTPNGEFSTNLSRAAGILEDVAKKRTTDVTLCIQSVLYVNRFFEFRVPWLCRILVGTNYDPIKASVDSWKPAWSLGKSYCIRVTWRVSIYANFIYPHHPQVALLLARHLCVMSWVLTRIWFVACYRIEPMQTMSLAQRKMPVAVVMRALAYLGHAKKDRLSTGEELAMDHTLQAMENQCIMLSERLVASPIPPLFTTHFGRLLVFYLFFLPIALYTSGNLDVPRTFVTVLAVGFAMLGLGEISHRDKTLHWNYYEPQRTIPYESFF